MRIIRQHLTYTKLAATLALFLAAGGAAWAASSSPKTIHACFKTRGGSLRVAAHCKRGERSLNWNQVGPQGLKGAKGASGSKGARGSTGLQGLAGPAGPSDVYATGLATGTLTNAYASFAKLSLPAGSYLLEAKATFNSEEKSSKMTCAIAPDPSRAIRWDAGSVSGEAKESNALSLTGAATFAAPQTVELVCTASAGSGKVENTRLIAVKTTALHGEVPSA
jgi:hypothetical protein